MPYFRVANFSKLAARSDIIHKKLRFKLEPVIPIIFDEQYGILIIVVVIRQLIKDEKHFSSPVFPDSYVGKRNDKFAD